MAQILLKVQTIIKLMVVFILLFTTTYNLAQSIDIESKANELGIAKSSLEGLLNSAINNNGDGNPTPEAITERFFTGQAAGDNFGYSASSAGDVNGDGFDDFIVGAYFNDAGGSNSGSAYIYFGGISIDNVADVIMTGEAADDYFSWSVSKAGDVNGDGYGDVIIGAMWNDAGGSNAGRAYIYYGGSSMDNTADVVMTGEAVGDYFGRIVSEAGDVNGDGYSDVIVGAQFNDTGGSNAGKAYIYYGGSSMDNIADVTIVGEVAEDQFGRPVSTAGDVNGDGYSDVIIGAFYNDAGGTNAGRAYIYYGGSSMDNTADVIMTGEAAEDWFGLFASFAGDVNGDGYSDVIVSAFKNDAGGTDAGRSYIYFGGSSMDNTADVTMTGEAASDYFGISISEAGDVNGDGYGDVIVGSNLNDAGGTDAGRSYVYFGGPSMDNIADVIMTGEAADDRFGMSVSEAGDVNGDGYDDVIIGASYNDDGGSNAGKAYLYLNSLTGPDIPDEYFTGEAAGDHFGVSVSTAGDVNGDGYSDIIVGANYNDDGGIEAGSSYIFYGGPSMDNTADVTMTGEAVGDRFGWQLSSAGDVNGDGYDDVIIGAPIKDSQTGRSYIYFGGTSMDNAADVTMTGVAAGDQFGISVSTAGDVNGDGYSDVIVGANWTDVGGTNTGSAYIYFGGASMDTTADVIMIGENAYDGFSNSVSSAGDVNGDGYGDVIIGCNNYGVAGRAYIYYGDLAMDNNADVIMTGETTGDAFGWSVSTAGDLNGDGYSDVIVGAAFSDSEGYESGRSYIFYGGSSMDTTADVTMTGQAASDHFGYSVSSAGDVNGDGYNDVIVGATSAGANEAGMTYIYYGGASMDNTADIIMSGENDIDIFGRRVSEAGDLNGDGLSDVIVGADYNDAGGDNAGRAYLYLSSSPLIKPRIMSVKDVNYDQGGYVNLKWVRSGYDAKGISKITEYLIQRSYPPDQNGFAWENIANMTASNESFYSYTASTPNDSMINNSGTYYFRITARTSDPNEYWRSNIMYGHSVDNLAPATPKSFDVQHSDTEVLCSWEANTEIDLYNYLLYRSAVSAIDPDTSTPIAQLTDTSFVDISPLTGKTYYFIYAQDIHNNVSSFSTDSIEGYITADIKVYLEGCYQNDTMKTNLYTQGVIPLSQPYYSSPWDYAGDENVAAVPNNVVDWILTELRDKSDHTTIVTRRAGFLLTNGDIVDIDGSSQIEYKVAEDDYYVNIVHRNHIAIMSSTPIHVSSSSGETYDFTTDSSNTYGERCKKLDANKWGMYSGDTDASGVIDAADRSNAWNYRNITDYHNSDVELNGVVDAGDRSITWNNRNVSAAVSKTKSSKSINKKGQQNEK